MFAFFLAGIVGANVEPASPSTLAGVPLGATLASVNAAQPSAQVIRTDSGARLTWNVAGGGIVVASTDRTGKVVEVDFVAREGEDGNIDVPCIGTFSIQDSHVNFDSAIVGKSCTTIGDGKYQLADGSVLSVSFEGPGDGQLHEATWSSAVFNTPDGTQKALRTHTTYAFPSKVGMLTLSVPPNIRVLQGSVTPSLTEYEFYGPASNSPFLKLREFSSAYDLRGFDKSCLNGKVAWRSDDGDSGTVVIGEAGVWYAMNWSSLSGARFSDVRTIVSSVNVNFGPTC
jgi:hypothetical protein